MKRLVFYTKPDCPLCEKAFVIIKKTQSQINFEIDIKNITLDQNLFDRYCFDIPVIEIDGVMRFKGRVSEEELKAALREARRPHL